MQETNLDLVDEINKEMQKIQMSPELIDKYQATPYYHTASVCSTTGDVMMQKTYLTLALSRVLTGGEFVVPQQIRLGLNMANTVEHWLQDVKLIVIPFMKANEGSF